MPQQLFITLPIADVAASAAFYEAIGFGRDTAFDSPTSACMTWGEAVRVMLVTHAMWRTFTDRPLPPAGSVGHMLSLPLASREAVDAMNEAAAAHGGRADAHPPDGHGPMYSRDIADPDGHLWGAFWMDAAPGKG